MKSSLFVFCFFIMGISSSFAQTSLKKAEKAYQETNYAEAIRYYQEFLNSNQSRNYSKTDVYYRLGKCYQELGLYKKAGENYQQVLKGQITHSRFYYDYSQWLRTNGAYLQAIEYYNLFLQDSPGQADLINDDISSCLFALSFASENKFAHCVLQPDVSTVGEEQSIAFYNDTLLYLTSLFAEGNNAAEKFFLYKSSVLNESFASPLLWQNNNIPKRGITNIAVYEYSRQLFYSIQKSGETELYTISIDIEKKQSPKKISTIKTETPVNGISVNKDGTRVYFSAKLKNGFGGYDIWYIEQENDHWSEPINIGTLINTSKNEITPFIWNDSILFFASDGQLENYGGFDIYSSFCTNDEFHKPENLKKPFNSSFNDMGLYLHSSSNFGALLSDRINDNVNIFRFDNLFTPHCYYGQVVDAVSQNPIRGANITVFDDDRKEWDIQTDEKGNYHFFTQKGEQYQVRITKPNYFSSSFSINDSVSHNLDSFKFSSFKKIPLNSLFLNKEYELKIPFSHPLTTELSFAGKKGLSSIVEFLIDNPHLSIHFTSTISCNNKEYATLLNTARIDSVIQYFVQNSISQNRLSSNTSVNPLNSKTKDSIAYSLSYKLFESPVSALKNDTSLEYEMKRPPIEVVPSFKPVIYCVEINTKEQSISEIRNILSEKGLDIKLLSEDEGTEDERLFAGPFLIKARALKIEEQLNAVGIKTFIKEEDR